MRTVIRFLTGRRVRRMGAAIGAVLIVALLAPKAAHAISAALVQVTNTLSNPVISLANHKAASQLVQLADPAGFAITPSLKPTQLAQYNTSTSDTGSTPYVVPAGQSLVITDLDFDIYNGSGDTGVLVSNGNSPPTAFGEYYERFDFYNVTDGVQHVTLASGMVFPAGATVGVVVTGNVSYITAVLRGYLTPE